MLPRCFQLFLRPSSAAFECLRSFVLHLLDTEWKVCTLCFWVRLYFSCDGVSIAIFFKRRCLSRLSIFVCQGYDYTFVQDVHLPEFLLDTAKGWLIFFSYFRRNEVNFEDYCSQLPFHAMCYRLLKK